MAAVLSLRQLGPDTKPEFGATRKRPGTAPARRRRSSRQRPPTGTRREAVSPTSGKPTLKPPPYMRQPTFRLFQRDDTAAGSGGVSTSRSNAIAAFVTANAGRQAPPSARSGFAADAGAMTPRSQQRPPTGSSGLRRGNQHARSHQQFGAADTGSARTMTRSESAPHHQPVPGRPGSAPAHRPPSFDTVNVRLLGLGAGAYIVCESSPSTIGCVCVCVCVCVCACVIRVAVVPSKIESPPPVLLHRGWSKRWLTWAIAHRMPVHAAPVAVALPCTRLAA